MTVHREGRDFEVVLEQYNCGDGSMMMSGEGASCLAVGDVLVTTRGGLERWRVETLQRRGRSFVADVRPVLTALSVVAQDAADSEWRASTATLVSLFEGRS